MPSSISRRRVILNGSLALLAATAPQTMAYAQTPADRLARLGLTLPPVAKPIALYEPFVRDGNLVAIAGQVPFVDGKVLHPGKVPTQVSIEEAQAAARQSALQILAILSQACDGNLERVAKTLRVEGWVNATPDFADHPKVINGASQLFIDVLGSAGRHSRVALGAGSLPLGAPVEVAALFALHPSPDKPTQ